MNRFCSECGSELQAGQAFCAECGTPVPNTAAGSASQPVPPKAPAPPPPVTKAAEAKKPFSFKKKLAFTLVAILTVGLVAGHYTIQARTSPADKLNEFIEAVESGNVEAMMEEIEIPEGVIGDDAVFREYLATLDSEVMALNLDEAAVGIGRDGITRVVTDENGYHTFRIKQEKFLGMYPVVSIEAIPIEVRIQTDLDEGELAIAGKTMDLSEGDQLVGILFPGQYPAVISSEGPAGSEQELTYAIFGNEGMTIDLLKEQLMVAITSAEPAATVFVDGESTEETVEQLKAVGPLFGGSAVSIHAELDGISSEIVEAMGGDSVELVFGKATVTVEETETPVAESSEFTAQDVEKFILSFRAAYERALNNKDFSQISPYLYADSVAYKELAEFVGDLGNEYFLYDFIEDRGIDYRTEGDRAYIQTEETFEFTNHLGQTIFYQRYKEYEIAQEDKMYQIVSISILDTERSR